MDQLKEEPRFSTIQVSGQTYSIYLVSPEKDYIQKRIAESGIPYELPMLEEMKKHLDKESLVLDIGANIGNHTFYLANVVGCNVIAFEANQLLTAAMERTIANSELADRVVVHPVAIGEVEGVAEFSTILPENLGGQSIKVGTGSIPVRSLDSFEISKKIDAIKIDVEGMELNVLKGGQKLLERDHPFLYIESITLKEFRTISEHLFALGYRYCATFNATPTHLFIHNSVEVISDAEHARRLDKVESDYLKLEITQLTRNLGECRMKYRSSTASHRTLTNDIAKLREDLSQANESAKILEIKYQKAKKKNKKLLRQYEKLISQQQETKNSEAIEHSSAEVELLKSTADAAAQESRELKDVVSGLKDDILRLEEEKQNLNEKAVAAEKHYLESLKKLEEKHNVWQKSSADAAAIEVHELRNVVSGLKDDILRLEEEKHNFNEEARAAEKSYLASLNKLENKHNVWRKQMHAWQTELRDDVANRVRSLVEQRTNALSALDIYKSQANGLTRYKGELEDLLNGRNEEISSTKNNIFETFSKKSNSLKKLAKELAISNQLRDPSVWEKAKTNTNTNTKVACIMDDFTYHSYKYECQLKQLSLGSYMSELEAFQPEILFLESAWRGKDEEWGNRVGHRSKEVVEIINWCKQRGIPTIFWNKEDPIHFETFLNLAKLVDFIFTTDIECIPRYMAALKHRNVFFLPFACQPAVHNPIEKYVRKNAFCFAGAYYVRYPDRTKDLETFVQEFPAYANVEIYDRNFGKDLQDYMFPDNYKPYIVGTLPFSEIDKAYKGYKYAINLNSIKQSQTMFARRIYELLASNTITVSNFSRGVRLMFGDLVVSTDSGSEALRRLNQVDSSELNSKKIRLAALRKVLSEHTYERRFDYVLSKAFERTATKVDIQITVYGFAKNETEIDHLLTAFTSQTYRNATLIIVGDDTIFIRKDESNVEFINHKQFLTSIHDMDDTILQWCAIFSVDDYYGPNYLLDLALATKYSSANVIGKSAFYELADGVLHLRNAGTTYIPQTEFCVRRSLFRKYHLLELADESAIDGVPDKILKTSQGLAIDEFNYARNGANIDTGHISEVSDLEVLQSGWSIDSLINAAEAMQPDKADISAESGSIPADELYPLFGKTSELITSVLDGSVWLINSLLPDGKHEYCYAKSDLTLQESGFDKTPKFHLETTPGLNVQMLIVYLNAKKEKLNHEIKYANKNNILSIPEGTVYIRYGLRFYASGTCQIERLIIGHKQLKPADLFSTAKHLVLTNHYPSYSDLYRNGFVHSRLTGYREEGLDVDVFRLRLEHPVSYHEFEGIDVITGSAEALHKALDSGRYKSVLVHFLDSDMWTVLKDYVDKLKITVWVHGAEIQVWQRRAFEFENMNESEIERQKEMSEKRRLFWRSVLLNPHKNLKLVFVSQYFAEEVSQDLDIDLRSINYEIVHNFVDKKVFPYVEKTEGHRKRILSIRPYASRKYANDMTVNAILELSKRAFFDDLEFALYGDGPLFDGLTAPLRAFSNVKLHKRFLSHQEISSIHKDYGVFLTPTRMDSQGVSRDEAMASGLVPISTAVTAIPEFVDERSGILVPGEDYIAMADAVEYLYYNPEKFLALSRSASERATWQSGFNQTILKEINIIKSGEDCWRAKLQ